MKRLLCLMLLACMVGCGTEITVDLGSLGNLLPSAPARPDIDYPDYEREQPTINLEQAYRQQNWLGDMREGSCVHATMVMLFRWQGREDLATKWRNTYENGSGWMSLSADFDREGVRYAYTWLKNDVKFLEWACNTRRGCGVTVTGGSHMVMLVHLDAKRAGIIDNNFPDTIKWIPRDEFLREWFDAYAWAVTPVYTPPPPLPYKDTNK